MIIKKIKILMTLCLIVFYSCSNNEDEFLNSYELEITLDGDISEFFQILSIDSSRNDGNGNFNDEQLLFKDSGETAPSFFTDEDLEVGTYRFVTAREAENLTINYEILIGAGETSNNATMTISVIVKRDGKEIDNFNVSYDESTGSESFSVNYNSDNSGYRCYCAINCNQLLGLGGLGPAVPCD